MNNVLSAKLAENVDLYVIPTDIFKTVSIRVFIPCELGCDYTYQALIPQVLERGTERFPDQKSIAVYLDELYDAGVSSNVSKYGNKQVLSFRITVINDRFTENSEKLFPEAVKFLKDLIFKPVTENGLFRHDYVLQEAFNLKQQILSNINDKPNYSIKRLNEEMNPGKDFTKNVYGCIEDIESLDETRLFNVYKNIIENNPVSIFVVGDVDFENVKSEISNEFSLKARKALPLYIPDAVIPESTKYVEEKMAISQGRLNIGYRTNITMADDDFFKLVMFNSILGGTVTSKLFANVREKAGLCYSIGSFTDKFNGQLIIYMGIDCKNKDKALELTRAQIKAIANGDISDFEFDAALKDALSELKTINDSSASMTNIRFRGIMAGRVFDESEYRKGLLAVTKDDVIKIASLIKEDTVYFLKSR